MLNLKIIRRLLREVRLLRKDNKMLKAYIAHIEKKNALV